jgi:hypothetical protein
MRNLIILASAVAMTGCAAVPQQTQQKTKTEHVKTLVQSLVVLGAIAYVANEVGDKNRNKQCANGNVIYRGVGNDRYYVC